MNRLFFIFLVISICFVNSCHSDKNDFPSDQDVLTDESGSYFDRESVNDDEDASYDVEEVPDFTETDEQPDAAYDEGMSTDDETYDEDVYVRPMETTGWIILNSDRDDISEIIARASEFGVDSIHLSHDIIMNIDELDDSNKVELIRDISSEAHKVGLKVWIWAHELANNSYAVCYDPDDIYWIQRKKVYSDALAKVPDVDGVVLMFGSSSPDPWYAQCVCLLNSSYCGDIDNKPVHIVKLLIEMARKAIVVDSGRELIVRTFIHFPNEQATVTQALSETPYTDFSVMPKDVPQDWQPYHPHDIGFYGALTRNTVAEFDLAGEYWGQSRIPFALPDYLQYRLKHQHSVGSNGAFGRIERGSNSAFGTPNEVNIYAFSKLIENVEYPVDRIWKEWIHLFYGVEEDSEASELLISALRRTFDIGRKMYYPKGFWMAKSSDIPEDADLGLTSNFEVKKISLWDADYVPIYDELKNPSAQTIADIAQEKHEARYLVEASLSDLEKAKQYISAEHYDDLKSRLTHLSYCVDIFDNVHQAIFRSQRIEKHNEENYLRWNIEQLTVLAGKMETEFGSGISPCNPDRIRSFIKALDDKAGDTAVEPIFYPVSDIKVESLSATEVTVTWKTNELTSGGVDYGYEIPDYGFYLDSSSQSAKEHSVKITGLDPGTLYRFRIRSRYGMHTTISGDFSFTTLR